MIVCGCFCQATDVAIYPPQVLKFEPLQRQIDRSGKWEKLSVTGVEEPVYAQYLTLNALDNSPCFHSRPRLRLYLLERSKSHHVTSHPIVMECSFPPMLDSSLRTNITTGKAWSECQNHRPTSVSCPLSQHRHPVTQ